MKYDFDEIINRHGSNSYKWDSAADADVLPMWVADMAGTTPDVYIIHSFCICQLWRRANHAVTAL